MAKPPRKRIEKLRLYRFQSYVDETIEFDRETNAFIGATDTGKSAITRALYWTLYHKPLRVDYTMWGEKHCFVTITFSDGVEITKGRKNNENYYVLKDANGVSETFKGFGAEVPPKVMEAHGMYLLHYVDGNEATLNISCQLDPIFMLEESATRRAKAVGVVSGADKVDGAVLKVNGWLKNANNSKKDLLKRIVNITAHLESYAYLDNLEVAITSLRNLLKSLSTSEAFYSSLLAIFTALRRLEGQREEMIRFLSFEEKHISLSNLYNNLERLHHFRDAIINNYSNYRKLTEDKEALNSILNKDPLVNKVADNYVKLSSIKTTRDRVESLFVEYSSIEKQIAALTVILGDSESLGEAGNLINALEYKISSLFRLRDKYEHYRALRERAFKGSAIIDKLNSDLHDVSSKYEYYLSSTGECPFCRTVLKRV